MDVAHAFIYKLWWRFREDKSLWSKYMHLRYCRGQHHTQVALVTNSSIIWRMMSVRQEAEQYLQWVVGRGDIDVSLDKWLEIEMPLLRERVSVKTLFASNHVLNEEYISRLLGSDKCLQIKNANVCIVDEEDKLCWTKCNDGKFSTGNQLDKGDCTCLHINMHDIPTCHSKSPFLFGN